MDKYEYRLKIDHIRMIVDKKKYSEAAELCGTIDWTRVKDVKVLLMVADIYSAVGQYKDAIEILEQAYEYTPGGRRIVYRLTELSLKADCYEDAEKYFEEFCKVAPTDQGRFILLYKMACSQHATVKEKIKILRAYKREDFDERWGYELAVLYAMDNNQKACIQLCDDIILWFGLGKYVEKALRLKQKYAPLTEQQKEKLEQIKEKKKQEEAEKAAAQQQAEAAHKQAEAEAAQQQAEAEAAHKQAEAEEAAAQQQAEAEEAAAQQQAEAEAESEAEAEKTEAEAAEPEVEEITEAEPEAEEITEAAEPEAEEITEAAEPEAEAEKAEAPFPKKGEAPKLEKVPAIQKAEVHELEKAEKLKKVEAPKLEKMQKPKRTVRKLDKVKPLNDLRDFSETEIEEELSSSSEMTSDINTIVSAINQSKNNDHLESETIQAQDFEVISRKTVEQKPKVSPDHVNSTLDDISQRMKQQEEEKRFILQSKKELAEEREVLDKTRLQLNEEYRKLKKASEKIKNEINRQAEVQKQLDEQAKNQSEEQKRLDEQAKAQSEKQAQLEAEARRQKQEREQLFLESRRLKERQVQLANDARIQIEQREQFEKQSKEIMSELEEQKKKQEMLLEKIKSRIPADPFENSQEVTSECVYEPDKNSLTESEESIYPDEVDSKIVKSCGTELPEGGESWEASPADNAEEAPEVSEMQEIPETLEVSELPEASEVTAAPEVAEISEAPEVTEVSETPEASEAPEVSETPEEISKSREPEELENLDDADMDMQEEDAAQGHERVMPAVNPDDLSKVWHFAVHVPHDEDPIETALGYLDELAEYTEKKIPDETVRVSGGVMNKKGLIKSIDKLLGKTILITDAGDMEERAVNELCKILEPTDSSILVVFIDTPTEIRRMLFNYPKLCRIITAQFYNENYTQETLMQYAKDYADREDSAFDISGEEAAAVKIAAILESKERDKRSLVENMINNAIEKAESKSIKKLFQMKYNKDGCLILRKKDIEES